MWYIVGNISAIIGIISFVITIIIHKRTQNISEQLSDMKYRTENRIMHHKETRQIQGRLTKLRRRIMSSNPHDANDYFRADVNKEIDIIFTFISGFRTDNQLKFSNVVSDLHKKCTDTTPQKEYKLQLISCIDGILAVLKSEEYST